MYSVIKMTSSIKVARVRATNAKSNPKCKCNSQLKQTLSPEFYETKNIVDVQRVPIIYSKQHILDYFSSFGNILQYSFYKATTISLKGTVMFSSTDSISKLANAEHPSGFVLSTMSN
ncbi:hypothetical protein QTN25_006497 [Entamoeba marina]